MQKIRERSGVVNLKGKVVLALPGNEGVTRMNLPSKVPFDLVPYVFVESFCFNGPWSPAVTGIVLGLKRSFRAHIDMAARLADCVSASNPR